MDDSSKTYQLQKQYKRTCSLTSDPSTQSHSHLTCQDLVEHIPSLAELDSERKADLAFMLLQGIPESHRNNVISRLTMDSQSRNRLEVLPQELIVDILCHLDVLSLLEMSLLSRQWYALCQDDVVWRCMFEAQHWDYDAIGMERYLAKDSSANYTIPSKQLIPSSPLLLQSTPIVRTSAPRYQRRRPTTSTTTTTNNDNTNAHNSSTMASTSTVAPTLFTRISNNTTTATLNNPFSVLKPFQDTTTCTSNAAIISPPKPRKPVLSQKVASSIPQSIIPPHPGHQHLLPHYDVQTHTRYIDWKSLYRQRFKIASAWKLGQYRPYRFRSDPASLRRQQQEESGSSSNNINDGDTTTTTTGQDITMPGTSSSLQLHNNNTATFSSSSSSELSTTETMGISPEPSSSSSSSLSQSQQQELQQPGSQGEQEPQQIISQLEQMEQRRQQQQQRDQHQDAVYSLVLDGAQHTIFSASRDKTLKEWHFNDAVATLQHTYIGLHQSSILCLDVDDHYIVSGSKDRTVVQTDRWQRKKLRVLHGHQDSVLNVVLDTDWIYSASKDRTIIIWSSATGELLRTLHGHREAVNAIKVYRNRIVSGSGDHTIKLWDRDTGECLRTFEGHERAISCLDFDGTYIVSGSKDKSITIWNLAGDIVRKFYAHIELVRTLQLQHTQYHDGYDNKRSDSLVDDDHDSVKTETPKTTTSTSRIIVSAGYNDNVNVWNFETGQLLHTFPRYYPGRIINLRFDNMKIVLGLDSGDIVVYDFAFGLDSRFLL